MIIQDEQGQPLPPQDPYTQNSSVNQAFMDRAGDNTIRFIEDADPIIKKFARDLKVARLLNDEGIKELMVEVSSQMHHYINLGNYNGQQIADKIADIKADINGKCFLHYEQWGIRNLVDWSTVVRIAGNVIESSYNRALNQSEKVFLGKTHSSVEKVEQTQGRGGAMFGLKGVFNKK